MGGFLTGERGGDNRRMPKQNRLLRGLDLGSGCSLQSHSFLKLGLDLCQELRKNIAVK